MRAWQGNATKAAKIVTIGFMKRMCQPLNRASAQLRYELPGTEDVMIDGVNEEGYDGNKGGENINS